MVVTPRQRKISALSQEIAQRFKFPSVEPLHIFLAIVHEGQGQPVHLLRKMGVDIERLRMELILHLKKKLYDQKADELSKNTPFLNKVGRDLTAMARAGTLTPVIGREDVIRKVAQVLTRKTKNNPIILGDAGVGKPP
jgi:ATP-dependent Clp protease ATP-binding subunit ClpC